MRDLAGDGIHRIFQALSDKAENAVSKILDKTTLIECFLSGKSESKWLKGVTKQKIELGREVKALYRGVEKKFLTGQIYEKSSCLWKNENGKYFSNESVTKSENYLFRHNFEFETPTCTKSLALDDSKLQEFLKADKYNELTKIRLDVIEELFHKFMADDQKVLKALKSVLEEQFLNFEEKIDCLNEKIESGHGEIIKNQNEILKEIQQLKFSNVATIAFGNPGSGKSTLLNSLAGECFFKSGLSFGKGLTSSLGEEKNNLGVFLDTPGLSDVSLRKDACNAIQEGLKKYGYYRILFFVTESNGRVIMQDATTMKLILEASPDIGKNYGIIVNMLSKGVVKKLKKDFHGFLNILFAGIPENRRCSYEKVLFLGKVNELDGEDNVLVSPDTLKSHEGFTLESFVSNVVPTVQIRKENVKEIPVENFDEITSEIENMSRIMEEKDDAWKEERRLFEEQRMKQKVKENK